MIGRHSLFWIILGLCISDLSLSTLLVAKFTDFPQLADDFAQFLTHPAEVAGDVWVLAVVRCLTFVLLLVGLRFHCISPAFFYHRARQVSIGGIIIYTLLLGSKLVASVLIRRKDGAGVVDEEYPPWRAIALSSSSLAFSWLEWRAFYSLCLRLVVKTITVEGGRHYQYLPLIVEDEDDDERNNNSEEDDEEQQRQRGNKIRYGQEAKKKKKNVSNNGSINGGGGGGGGVVVDSSSPHSPIHLGFEFRTLDPAILEQRRKLERERRVKKRKEKKDEKKRKDKEEKEKSLSAGTILRIMRLAKEDWVYLSLAFFFLVVAATGQVLIPHYTGQVIDTVAIADQRQAFINSIVLLSVTSIACAIATGLRGSNFQIAMARLNIRVRNKLFAAMLQQEIGFFDVTPTGDITSRLSADTTKMSDQISLNANVFLRSLVQAIGVLIFMAILSWELTLVTLTVIPLVMISSKVYGKYYGQLQSDVQDAQADSNNVAEEAISSMRTVRAFCSEAEEIMRYEFEMHETYLLSRKQAFAYAGYAAAFTLLPNIVTVVVLFYGGHLVLDNNLTGGALVSFVFYQMSLSQAINSIGDVWTGLMSAIGAAYQVFEWMDRPPLVKNTGKVKKDRLEGSVEFRNVCFTYPSRPTTTVLSDLSFKLPPSNILALVGPSGGGKSSCISLIERFYEPLSGVVLLDNLPVSHYDNHFLRSQIALVGQEPVLFARSLRENICYGLDGGGLNLPDSVIIDAAKKAHAHGFISQLENGYDTSAGEKGQQMSGGQKQRIAIARALVRNPSILLLDEATSALDTHTEHLVQMAIDEAMKDRTVIIIAHRLSTVRRADLIVVVDKGKVVETGNHTELLKKEGLYFNLVQRQLETVSETKEEQ